MIPIATLNQEWISALRLIMHHGRSAAPRNYETYERPHQAIIVDMRYCVLTHPERALSYQFMAAEAYWILSGGDRVDGVAPWNKHIAKFSDDVRHSSVPTDQRSSTNLITSSINLKWIHGHVKQV